MSACPSSADYITEHLVPSHHARRLSVATAMAESDVDVLTPRELANAGVLVLAAAQAKAADREPEPLDDMPDDLGPDDQRPAEYDVDAQHDPDDDGPRVVRYR